MKRPSKGGRKTKAAEKIKAPIYKNKFVKRYITDISFRAKISLYVSLLFNILYAIFKIIAGIHYASFWFGAKALVAMFILQTAMFVSFGEDDMLERVLNNLSGFCVCLAIFVLAAIMVTKANRALKELAEQNG